MQLCFYLDVYAIVYALFIVLYMCFKEGIMLAFLCEIEKSFILTFISLCSIQVKELLRFFI